MNATELKILEVLFTYKPTKSFNLDKGLQYSRNGDWAHYEWDGVQIEIDKHETVWLNDKIVQYREYTHLCK